MSLLHMDGFDFYSNNGASYQSRYTVNDTGTNIGTAAGRFGNLCLNFAAFNASFINKALGASYSQIVAGFAFSVVSGLSNLDAAASGGTPIFRVFDASLNQIGQLSVDSSGAVRWGRADNTTNNVAASATGVMLGTPWQYIEVILTRHATAGSIQVYVDGTQVINTSAVNTGSADIGNVRLYGTTHGTALRYDDWYVANSATRIGERRVETLVPSADTATKNFTPNSGTANFSRVNELPHDGDTSYVSSATPGAIDIYALADLSTSPTTIDAVQIVSEAEKDNASTRTYRNKLLSGATTGNGATKSLLSSYNFTADLFETDPATGAAWTAAAVNALQAGVEVVA